DDEVDPLGAQVVAGDRVAGAGGLEEGAVRGGHLEGEAGVGGGEDVRGRGEGAGDRGLRRELGGEVVGGPREGGEAVGVAFGAGGGAQEALGVRDGSGR